MDNITALRHRNAFKFLFWIADVIAVTIFHFCFWNTNGIQFCFYFLKKNWKFCSTTMVFHWFFEKKRKSVSCRLFFLIRAMEENIWPKKRLESSKSSRSTKIEPIHKPFTRIIAGLPFCQKIPSKMCQFTLITLTSFERTKIRDFFWKKIFLAQ